MNIVQNPDGSISIIDDEIDQVKDISDMTYERSEIPQYLIDECDELSNTNDKTYFIFDKSVSSSIKLNYNPNKETIRDIKIDEILEDTGKYHIDDELGFKDLPSRFSYYDTETKLSDRYVRYKFVLDFIKKLGFIPSEFNLGPEYEQSYSLEINYILNKQNVALGEYIHKYILRLRPNLFISIISDNSFVYDTFFNKNKIINVLNETCPIEFKSVIRDIKIEEIMK